MNNIVIIRSGGDLATGVIQKFHRSGFNVLVLESAKPTAIRRTVALSEAVYDNVAKVEDMVAKKVHTLEEIHNAFSEKSIPILVDPECKILQEITPICLIDAILAKKNLGTSLNMANVVIGLGPGFTANLDVDCVIETMRGHDLGRLILNGSALPNTGIPGEIGGKSALRVIHASCDGYIKNIAKIGQVVDENEIIFTIGDTPMKSPFKGLVRGLIREDIFVRKGLKVCDIDPRIDVDFNTISDKARALGGAALEAYFYVSERKKNDG